MYVLVNLQKRLKKGKGRKEVAHSEYLTNEVTSPGTIAAKEEASHWAKVNGSECFYGIGNHLVCRP